MNTDIKLIAAGIDVDSYEIAAPKLRRNDFGGNKYVAPFSFVVKSICRDYMSFGHPLSEETGDVCTFFIEEGEWTPSIRDAVRRMKEPQEGRWWRDRIGTDTYGKKAPEKYGDADVIPLLQVGDLGVFLASKFLSNAPDGVIAWRPYFEKLERAKKLFDKPLHINKEILGAFFGLYGFMNLSEEERDKIWDEVGSSECQNEKN